MKTKQGVYMNPQTGELSLLGSHWYESDKSAKEITPKLLRGLKKFEYLGELSIDRYDDWLSLNGYEDEEFYEALEQDPDGFEDEL